jgi:hypothetical protein
MIILQNRKGQNHKEAARIGESGYGPRLVARCFGFEEFRLADSDAVHPVRR